MLVEIAERDSTPRYIPATIDVVMRHELDIFVLQRAADVDVPAVPRDAAVLVDAS